MIERIVAEGTQLAIIIRRKHKVEGISFVTEPSDTMQIGLMQRPAGYSIEPHLHKAVERRVSETHEVLIIRDGKVRVNFFDNSKAFVESRVLDRGDIVLLCGGGHGFEVLEDADIVEVKQGPYAGDLDKERFRA